MRAMHPAGDPAHAFTAIFPGYEKDEGAFASVVTRHLHLPHSTVTINASDLVNDWEKFCYHQEEPFGSASAYAQFKVFELARKKGVKVLLDGQGADETLGGYLRYYKWYWQELFRKGKLRRSGELAAAKEAGIQENFGIQNMIASYFPGFATIVLEKQYLLKAIKHEDLAKDFVIQQSREAYYTVPEHFTLNGVLYFSTRTHGLGELLRLADRNAMAHGREVRLPFLSHELVEFIFSLPAHFKIRKGWSKWILRESVKDRLPEEITWRRNKVGFEPPQREWMADPRIQEAIHEAKKLLVDRQVLKPSVLNKAITPHSAHSLSNTDWRYLSSTLLFK
jgi:asparagine synthase (glutamine-hydrolysing)